MSFRHIVRIAHTDLDGNLLVPFALTKIQGISIRLAEMMMRIAAIDPNQRLGYINDRDIKKIEDLIHEPTGIPPHFVNRRKDIKSGTNDHVIAAQLALVTKSDIDRMRRTKSLKGIRHQLGLKVRGQRTKSTGRRGNIVGVHRKKLQAQKKK
jgi:small subunit ribosomal protein S13